MLVEALHNKSILVVSCVKFKKPSDVIATTQSLPRCAMHSLKIGSDAHKRILAHDATEKDLTIASHAFIHYYTWTVDMAANSLPLPSRFYYVTM